MNIVDSILESLREVLAERQDELTCSTNLKHAIELFIEDDCVVLRLTCKTWNDGRPLNKNLWYFNIGRVQLNDPSIDVVDAIVKLINNRDLSSIFKQ
jgi:hypothetical protein